MKRTHVPRRGHVERHFTATETVRDIVIGMSDGLTVPFALAAGISGAIAVSHIIVTAGVAELAAGGISMGLGGYLAARTDYEHYGSERKREFEEVREIPDEEAREVFKIFRHYGLSDADANRVTSAITANKTRWVDFMMRFELQLDEPDQKRAPMSALTIGGSYVVGGLIPLLPYMLVHDATRALYFSALFTLLALFAFGAIKGKLTGLAWVRSAFQTVAIGGVAAGVAFAIARLVNGHA
ncbi:MAG: VIT1/CCC1 transporter family protein [Candidatus Eremiobacteraeota bacterium]|nr:VIT1/CCC1 transporter family protein [Candidatus Eremiobacteraeota bacterium]